MSALEARGGTPEPIRISDSERNAAVERINEFFGEGRLDFEETSGRLDEIYAAKTDVELEQAFRGLPRPAAPKERRRLPRDMRRVVQVATPAGLCTVIWAMTGAHGYFWPEWVWFGSGLSIIGYLRPGHRHIDRDHRRRERSLDPASPGPLGPASADGRMILTAVFADIVNSTEKASGLGDARWRELLRSFEYTVDRLLVVNQGRKLFTKGDEVVATFRTPAQAIDYARGIRDGVARLGLELHVGIHTGEVEGRKGDLSGIALHIGQRVSASAAAGEILVSSTVRDLALGSGIGFVDRGEHELRGLPGTWRLYAVEDVEAHA
jgi:class 3 adenylate cyclase